MLLPEERLEMALAKRKEIEQEIREAELLLEICRKHLARADELIYGLEAKITAKEPRVQRAYSHMKEAERQKILEAFEAGQSARQIAAEFGRSVQTVITKLQEAGLTESRPRGLFRKKKPKNPDGAHARQDRVLRLTKSSVN